MLYFLFKLVTLLAFQIPTQHPQILKTGIHF